MSSMGTSSNRDDEVAATTELREETPMERSLNNYQVTMFHYTETGRREQVISVRDLAYAMQAILAYDEQEDVEPEASALDEVVTWARRVCGSFAPLTSGSPLDRLSDALQRLDREEVRAT